MKLVCKIILFVGIVLLTACSGLNQFSKKGHFPAENNTGILIIGVDIRGWSTDPWLNFIKHDMNIADKYLTQISSNPRKEGYRHQYFILELEEGPWALKHVKKFVSNGLYKNKYITTFDERYVFDVKRNQATYFGEFSIESKKKQSYLTSSLSFNREVNSLQKVTEYLKSFPNVNVPVVLSEPRIVKRHDRLKEMLKTFGLPMQKKKAS
jgi:hypothetical protein